MNPLLLLWLLPIIPITIIGFILLRNHILKQDKFKCWLQMIDRISHPRPGENLYRASLTEEIITIESIALSIITQHLLDRPLWCFIFCPLDKEKREEIEEYLQNEFSRLIGTRIRLDPDFRRRIADPDFGRGIADPDPDLRRRIAEVNDIVWPIEIPRLRQPIPPNNSLEEEFFKRGKEP